MSADRSSFREKLLDQRRGLPRALLHVKVVAAGKQFHPQPWDRPPRGSGKLLVPSAEPFLGKRLQDVRVQAVIGWRSDVETVTADGLRHFYDTYYWPSNATATVAGMFEARDALDVIDAHFGAIAAGPEGDPDAPEPLVHRDLDAAVTRLGRELHALRELNGDALHDPRVEIVHQDAMV